MFFFRTLLKELLRRIFATWPDRPRMFFFFRIFGHSRFLVRVNVFFFARPVRKFNFRISRVLVAGQPAVNVFFFAFLAYCENLFFAPQTNLKGGLSFWHTPPAKI